MSINTIKWGCLYSGAGIAYSPPEKEIKKLFFNINSDNPSNNIYQFLKPLKCLYKKAKPEFVNIPSEISDQLNYTWISKSFNKIISPSTQSYSILALCNLAEFIYREDVLLGGILVKNAEILYDFLSTYLRNEDGLFISVEDKAKSYSDDIKIKPCQKDSKLNDQLCVLEALLCLYHITSKNELMEYFNSQNSKYVNEARSIFNYIYENYHDFLELTSKQISLSISSLVRCCKYEEDTEQLVNYNQLIALLCAELESRIKVTGELEKSFNNPAVASFITHFRAASALLEGSVETGIRKFESLSLRIYDNLADLFDFSMGLFVTGDSTELNYSIRDISEIVKGFFVYYSMYKKDRILKIIIDFYTNAIEKSGIVPSIVDRQFKFKDNEVNMTNEIPLLSECSKAPVFLKSFRYVFKKTQTFTVSKYFNSSYALYSSYLFLNYLTPIINIL
jgi:hypothetical protein